MVPIMELIRYIHILTLFYDFLCVGLVDILEVIDGFKPLTIKEFRNFLGVVLVVSPATLGKPVGGLRNRDDDFQGSFKKVKCFLHFLDMIVIGPIECYIKEPLTYEDWKAFVVFPYVVEGMMNNL